MEEIDPVSHPFFTKTAKDGKIVPYRSILAIAKYFPSPSISLTIRFGISHPKICPFASPMSSSYFQTKSDGGETLPKLDNSS